MELNREILRKINHQKQQFKQTIKILLENPTRFTDIVSGALQMMDVIFQQQRTNVMVPPENNYPSNKAGSSQWTRQQNCQHSEWNGQERDVEKHYTKL